MFIVVNDEAQGLKRSSKSLSLEKFQFFELEYVLGDDWRLFAHFDISTEAQLSVQDNIRGDCFK